MSVVSSQKCRTMLPVRPSRGLSVVCEAGVTGHKAKVCPNFQNQVGTIWGNHALQYGNGAPGESKTDVS